ncbi:hypothetical protein GGH12_002587 [Coemansia sp. RSA 1822]|nr:hypothetical protein LPJ76_005099 [Coemansia sp. RSA 638]KAJ2563410.1 hypothetical protein GGH12_002587 [Coemansia sp. RSA 1822]
MVAPNAKAKVAALKKKLHGQRTKHAKAKPPVTVGTRQQRVKSLTKAFATNTGLDFSQASTRHTAGRRVIRESLDQSTAANEVCEALRGIGKPNIPTPAQLARKAKEEREQMARAYEQDALTLEQNIDDLAKLMSTS